jgi:hypothetical protein
MWFYEPFMDKKATLGFIFLTGSSFPAFAGTGSANDGLEFLLFLMAFLLLVAGFLYGIDYLNRNGKELMHRVRAFIKKKMTPPKVISPS